MKQNMSSLDRLVRLVIAVLIGVLYYTNVIAGTTGIILVIIGCVLLATSVLGVCPIYALFHMSTKTGEKAG